MINAQFPWLRRKRQYPRRCLSTRCSIAFLVILLFAVQIYRHQPDIDDHSQDQPKYCNQSIIRRFYMHDRSPEQLLTQDPIRLPFTYELTNANFCTPLNPPHALIFVISKSINFGMRNTIRRTWGNLVHINSMKKFAHLRLKLLFLLDIDETYRLSIHLEQSIYHDLVQVHLPQHYVLSTYRDMAILHWTETFCSKALLTVKTDDDIFLNIFLLANVLSAIISNRTIHSPAVIYGSRIRGALAVRYSNNPSSEGIRYITTDDEYPCRYYPDYISGFGYMITRNARLKLLGAFFREEKLFHLSDVYVTGILPEYLNIPRRHIALQINSRSSDDCESFFHQRNAFACASTLHYRDEQTSSIRDGYFLQRFNKYWKLVYKHRMQSLHCMIEY